jgi:hypothetical protein
VTWENYSGSRDEIEAQISPEATHQKWPVQFTYDNRVPEADLHNDLKL